VPRTLLFNINSNVRGTVLFARSGSS